MLNTQTEATKQAAGSGVGKAADAAVAWWRKPIAVEDLPRWLRTPVQWGQAGVRKAAEPAQQLFAQAQQRAADATVRQLDQGVVSESQLTAAIDLARDAVRSTYNVLLGISWATETPYTELLKKGSQSSPSGDATYTADQPRMPWQDVQVRIEGPAVYDLARNFVKRWNSVQASYLLGPLEARTRIPSSLLPTKPAKGNLTINLPQQSLPVAHPVS